MKKEKLIFIKPQDIKNKEAIILSQVHKVIAETLGNDIINKDVKVSIKEIDNSVLVDVCMQEYSKLGDCPYYCNGERVPKSRAVEFFRENCMIVSITCDTDLEVYKIEYLGE